MVEPGFGPCFGMSGILLFQPAADVLAPQKQIVNKEPPFTNDSQKVQTNMALGFPTEPNKGISGFCRCLLVLNSPLFSSPKEE